MGIFGKKMNFPDQKKRNFGLGQKIEKIVCFFTWILINFFFIRELFRLIFFFEVFIKNSIPFLGTCFQKKNSVLGRRKLIWEKNTK